MPPDQLLKLGPKVKKNVHIWVRFPKALKFRILRFQKLLTILTGKTMYYSIQYKNGYLAASDFLNTFTQSIKFHYTFHYHVLTMFTSYRIAFRSVSQYYTIWCEHTFLTTFMLSMRLKPLIIILMCFEEKNDQIYPNTRVSTRFNTSQHESTKVNTNQYESYTNQHESDTSQHESARVQHESTQTNTNPTRVNTNQHESKTSLDHIK